MTALRTFDSAAATAIDAAIGTAVGADQLDKCARLLWRSYGEGQIGDDDAQVLQSFIDRRRPPPLAQTPASQAPAKPGPLSRRFTPRPCRRRLSDAERKRRRERKRMLGGSGGMPDKLRCLFTEGERAALCIVGGECKRHGVCDLTVEEVADRAGVGKTTVQNATHEAKRLCLISLNERRVPGRKSLPNLIKIISLDWRSWIKRGPTPGRDIGSKISKNVSTSKTTYNDDGDDHAKPADPCTRGEAQKWVGELARIAGHDPDHLPDTWRSKGVPVVTWWLNQLDKARIPRNWLRLTAIHVMKRKPDAELPFSICYFAPEVARLIRMVERDRKEPLPRGGVNDVVSKGGPPGVCVRMISALCRRTLR